MNRIFSLLLGAVFALSNIEVVEAATPVVSVQIVPVPSGAIKSRFVDGIEDPTAPECPTGWNCASRGNASGSISEVSSTEFILNVEGSSDRGNFHYTYKPCGTGDCEVTAHIPATWSGHLEAFTAFGVGIAGSADATTPVIYAWFPNSGLPRCNSGTFPSTMDNTLSASAGTLPLDLAATYDRSALEGRCLYSTDNGATWITYGVISNLTIPTTAIGYVFGDSHEDDVFTQADLTAITNDGTISSYTPVDPTPSAPTLVTPILNQTGQQGVAFSFVPATGETTCANNWTGETSYSIPATGTTNGLPTSTGLSFNTSTCALTGTPAAADVGTRNLRISGVNASGSTGSTFSMTISASTGSTFTINSGTATFDCAAQGVKGGDTIKMAAGTRGKLTIQNCTGLANNYITITNDTAGSTPTTINKGTSGSFSWVLDNIKYVKITGCNKYSGAPAGTHGVSVSGGAWTVNKNGGTTGIYGIRVTRDSGASENPTAYIKIGGTSTDWTLECVEVDGISSAGTGGSGIGISVNDHTVPRGTIPWRENIIIRKSYFHDNGFKTATDAGGECLYVGPNPIDNDVLLRNIEIGNNVVENCSRDGINVKSVRSGTNRVHHNWIKGTGQGLETDQNSSIAILASYRMKIDKNYMENTGGDNIQFAGGSGLDPVPAGTTPLFEIYNNTTINPGTTTGVTGNGIQVGMGTSTVDVPTIIEHNTVIDSEGPSVNCSTHINPCTVRYNVLAAPSVSIFGADTATSNSMGTEASMNFVGGGDYHLTNTSGACNAATGSTMADDYEDTARPLDSAPDRGADEAAACP